MAWLSGVSLTLEGTVSTGGRLRRRRLDECEVVDVPPSFSGTRIGNTKNAAREEEQQRSFCRLGKY